MSKNWTCLVFKTLRSCPVHEQRPKTRHQSVQNPDFSGFQTRLAFGYAWASFRMNPDLGLSLQFGLLYLLSWIARKMKKLSRLVLQGNFLWVKDLYQIFGQSHLNGVKRIFDWAISDKRMTENVVQRNSTPRIFLKHLKHENKEILNLGLILPRKI